MEQINEYEIDGLLKTMEGLGINGLMKYTDVLVLNHMINRRIFPYHLYIHIEEFGKRKKMEKMFT